jgi:sigma-B regulation protein RsbU (phosphoserine phosphatase)
MAMNRMLHQRNLEEYYCTLCYAMFDFKKRTVTLANSGLPYPVKCANGKAEQIPLPGIPLGSFGESTYEDVTLELKPGDVFVFCSDGISEAFDEANQEFGARRLMDVIETNSERTAKDIVSELFSAVQAFCGDAPQSDDRTVVVVKIQR